MSMNIKNSEVESLVNEIVRITGESKTEAIRKALSERKQRLALQVIGTRDEEYLYTFLQNEVWPHVPQHLLGTRLTKAEEEAILGYGDDGV